MGITVTKLANGNVEVTGNGQSYTLLQTMHVFRDNSQTDGVFLVSQKGQVTDVIRASNVDKLVFADASEFLSPTGDELYDYFKNDFFFMPSQSALTTYYVRPAGSTYGTGDGTSYENAWSGMASVDESLINNNELAICGTHLETFSFTDITTTLIGNDPNESGVIDSENTRVIGLKITGNSNVTIESLKSTRATTSCFSFEGKSEGVTNNCITDFSGNEGVQHRNYAKWTHNNLTSVNNVDDGVSGHESADITINGGTFTDNSENLAFVNDVKATINGPLVLSGSIVSDFSLRCTGGVVLNDVSCDGEITVDSANPAPTTYKTAVFNNCVLLGNLSVKKGQSIELNNSVSNNIETSGFDTDEIYVNDSLVINHRADNEFSKFVFYRSRVMRSGFANTIKCNFIARNSLFDNTNSANHLLPFGSRAVIDMKYCTIVNTYSNKESIYFGGIPLVDPIFENITLYGNETGRSAVFGPIGSSVTIKNAIVYGFARIDNGTDAAGWTWENCNFFNNTVNMPSGTNTNPVVGDPLFADAPNYDFTLGVGSSCLNSGATLTDDEGIDAADWGNGVDETPVVTTINQSGTWDVGTYIQ